MTPEQFVSCMRIEILEASLADYRNDLERSLTTADRRGTHWPRMADFYASLSPEQRERFFDITRQVIVDTLSTVLGVLDGSTLLKKYRDDFHLTYGDGSRQLNGDLQSIFLGELQDLSDET